MKLWLDENCALDLSQSAVMLVEVALRAHIRDNGDMSSHELENAANVIRAHLQHLPTREPKR